MYISAGRMGYKETKLFEDHVWPERRIELKRGWVAHIDHAQRTLEFAGGERLAYDRLLIATGAPVRDSSATSRR